MYNYPLTASQVLEIARQQKVEGTLVKTFPGSGQELRRYTIRMPDGTEQAHGIKALPDHHVDEDYEARVQALEAEGICRSDAQGIVDAEIMQQ